MEKPIQGDIKDHTPSQTPPPPGNGKIKDKAKEPGEKALKEDFKDENVPVEPILDKDGNEIGGEG